MPRTKESGNAEDYAGFGEILEAKDREIQGLRSWIRTVLVAGGFADEVDRVLDALANDGDEPDA